MRRLAGLLYGGSRLGVVAGVPGAGDKPLASRSLRPRYISPFRHRPSVWNSAAFAGGEPASRLIGGHIPDRESGTCFHSNRSCRLAPAHRGMKNRMPVAWYSELAWWICAEPLHRPLRGIPARNRGTFSCCCRHRDEVGSPMSARRWWYRGWRSFAGCWCDWIPAHPVSGYGACFRSNRPCRLVTAFSKV